MTDMFHKEVEEFGARLLKQNPNCAFFIISVSPDKVRSHAIGSPTQEEAVLSLSVFEYWSANITKFLVDKGMTKEDIKRFIKERRDKYFKDMRGNLHVDRDTKKAPMLEDADELREYEEFLDWLRNLEHIDPNEM